MALPSESRSRFTLAQLFMAIAVVATALALLRSEGCGTPYAKVHSLAFSPDGRQLAVVKLNARNANVTMKMYLANLTRTISLVDVELAEVAKVVDCEFRPGNHGPAFRFWRNGRESIAFNSNGKSLFVLNFGGGDIRLLDLESDRSTGFFTSTGQDEVQDFALSSDRTILTTNNEGAGVILVDAKTGKPLLSNPSLFAFNYRGPSIGLSSDNRWLAIGEWNRVQLYDINANCQRGSAIPCSGPFAFAPHGNQLAVVNEKTVRVCDPGGSDAHDLTCIGEVHTVLFTPDSKRLVVAIEDAVIVLDVDSGEELIRLENLGWATALACSPAGDVVAIGSNHGSLTLWHTDTGQSRTIQVPGNSGYPWTLPATLLAVVISFRWFSRRKWRAAS